MQHMENCYCLVTTNRKRLSFGFRDKSPSEPPKVKATFHFVPVSAPTSSHIFRKLVSLCRYAVVPSSRSFSYGLRPPTCLPRTIVPDTGRSKAIICLATFFCVSRSKRCKNEAACTMSKWSCKSLNGLSSKTSAVKNFDLSVSLS